ncbi:hypothetical protein PENCOP_c009G06532 [Penicillium coprophilum]|uniref:Cytochrome P450 n=1 Tax=Penicillium coprophilum TaxID=36646 RepID=A0A1V6UHK8_9EURO|nr:hypothetical protein PENCOP_c009G06532 [Penicillium coprophilum]
MLVLVALAMLAILYFYRHHRPNFPPGPQGLLIIGNLHQIPATNSWRKFKAWHRTYGPIISVKLGTRRMVVLGSHEVAKDLLVKRAAIYSSRPKVLTDRASNGLHMGFMPSGPRWAAHHRIHASLVNKRASQGYQPIQDLESTQLVYELLSTEDFPSRFHRFASSVINSLAYGKRLERGDEHEVVEIKQVTEKIAGEAVNVIAEAFPILDWLPKCLAPWKRAAEALHQRQVDLFKYIMEFAFRSPSWNWTKQVEELSKGYQMDWIERGYIIGSLYQAGNDTTAIALEVFVMACVLHPDAVHQAHRELDQVVGRSRLPSFDDMYFLPYVNAFLNEVLRWRSVAPGGLHHATVKDDQYRGFYIPKGTIVVANHWSLDMDEVLFDRPEDFNPDRWIQNPNLPLSAFGFGQRVCPGQHIARNSLFIAISRLLWAFDFGHVYCDGEKLEINPLEMTQGLSSRPSPFKASIQVRGPEIQQVIEQAWIEAEKDVNILLENVDSGLSNRPAAK